MILIRTRFVMYRAMAIYPFVFLKHMDLAKDESLINHERIHLRQQVEMLLLPFYLLYLLHYVFNLIRFRNHDLAYRNIVFEKEAYACDADPDYLKHRKFWRFIHYF